MFLVFGIWVVVVVRVRVGLMNENGRHVAPHDPTPQSN
jgi:hypothetical protein